MHRSCVRRSAYNKAENLRAMAQKYAVHSAGFAKNLLLCLMMTVVLHPMVVEGISFQDMVAARAATAFNCSSTSDCDYDQCSNVECSSDSSYCQNNRWFYACEGAENKKICVVYIYDPNDWNQRCNPDDVARTHDPISDGMCFCPDPSPCAAGSFSTNGNNNLGNE